MAEVKVGFQLGSSLASKHLLDAQYIKGTYTVVNSLEERNALPVATVNNDGVILKGSLVYVINEEILYIYNGSEYEELELGGSGNNKYLYFDKTTNKVYIQDENEEPVELSELLNLIS